MKILKLDFETLVKYRTSFFKTLNDLSPSQNIETKKLEDIFNKITGENGHVFVVVVNEIVVCTVKLLLEHKLSRGGVLCGHIEDVVVDTQYRGNAYGVKLTRHAIDYALEKGAYKISLHCKEDMVEYYEACGFKDMGHNMEVRA